jgi:hypothetical protein
MPEISRPYKTLCMIEIPKYYLTDETKYRLELLLRASLSPKYLLAKQSKVEARHCWFPEMST